MFRPLTFASLNSWIQKSICSSRNGKSITSLSQCSTPKDIKDETHNILNCKTNDLHVKAGRRSNGSYSDTSGDGIDKDKADNLVEQFKGEIKNFAQNWKNVSTDRPVPVETDIVVVGGGAIGLSVAYWLKKRNPEGFQLTVVERDPSYTRAATTLSVASVRQQFSLVENIQMSMFSAEFLRDIRDHLSVLDLDPPDIQFNPQGYLLLAGSQDAERIMCENHKTQLSCGAKVDLMDSELLRAKFPWLNTEGLMAGTYGLANEGWFDPWLFLTALKVKCMSLGVKFVKGEVTGFTNTETTGGVKVDGQIQRRKNLETLLVKADDGKIYPLKFAVCVNCAGPWAGEVGKMAGIGAEKTGVNSIPIPIEPRKRYVYVFHCPDGPGLNTPMLVDSSGVYVRREGLGGHYICGTSPNCDGDEPDTSHLDVDYKLFEEVIWPTLAHRIPCFENLKLKSAWAGFYDYNYFDQNLIIGNHPYFRNLMIAAGCSGHGIQQSPAIGRAMAEYILDNEFQTIDLSRFSFDRVLDDEPVLEDSCFII